MQIMTESRIVQWQNITGLG